MKKVKKIAIEFGKNVALFTALILVIKVCAVLVNLVLEFVPLFLVGAFIVILAAIVTYIDNKTSKGF